MTKADIVDRIASATGLTRVETEAVVEGFMVCVSGALREGDRVELRGFGTFRVEERAPRVARNPSTGAEIEIGRRFVPVFKPARELRELVDEQHQRAG